MGTKSWAVGFYAIVIIGILLSIWIPHMAVGADGSITAPTVRVLKWDKDNATGHVVNVYKGSQKVAVLLVPPQEGSTEPEFEIPEKFNSPEYCFTITKKFATGYGEIPFPERVCIK